MRWLALDGGGVSWPSLKADASTAGIFQRDSSEGSQQYSPPKSIVGCDVGMLHV
jgi:hypothetical protein